MSRAKAVETLRKRRDRALRALKSQRRTAKPSELAAIAEKEATIQRAYESERWILG